MKINELITEVHKNARKKGFWDKKREIGTLLMLIVSEVSEAMEADRRLNFANIAEFFADTRDNKVERNEAFEKHIKDSFEDELADAVIRIFDLCGRFDIDLEFHILEKMKYNKSRPHKHGKAY
jgi:NTP pyrophosphatase (non-canonical NTP hydrolase)